MSQPYLPLYTDALLGDIRVQALTFEERAAWVLLLAYLWQADGKLRDDIVSRLLQCPPETWQKLKAEYIKIGLLHSSDGHLINHRITRELCKAEYLSNVRRESAKKMHEKRQKRVKKR